MEAILDRAKKRISLRLIVAAAVLGSLVVLAGCTGSNNYSTAFTYPPGSRLGECRYLMQVDMYWDEGPYSARSTKRARVRIWNEKNQRVLDDRFDLGKVMDVEATTDWRTAGVASVTLYECPTKELMFTKASDEQLLKSGAHVLRKFSYRLDPKTGRFEPQLVADGGK